MIDYKWQRTDGFNVIQEGWLHAHTIHEAKHFVLIDSGNTPKGVWSDGKAFHVMDIPDTDEYLILEVFDLKRAKNLATHQAL